MRKVVSMMDFRIMTYKKRRNLAQKGPKLPATSC